MQVHFMAIGGSMIYQLALALLKKGYTVSGSDDGIFEPARSNLEKRGLNIEPGSQPDRVHPELDAVKRGMHVRMDNPEVQRAKPGGQLIFNETDSECVRLVKGKGRKNIRYQPDGVAQLTIGDTSSELNVSGEHNLLNVHAASKEFTEAMSSFSSTSERLEVLTENKRTVVYNPRGIKAGFDRKERQLFDDREGLTNRMQSFSYDDTNLPLTSSGNFDGADMLTFAVQVTGSNH